MYSDNDLNALLDNELSEAEAKKLREALNNDAALANRLERLAMADSIVKSAYQGIESDPLPQAILEMLGDEAEAGSTNSNVVKLKAVTFWSRPMQAAAVIVLAVGLFLGSSMLSDTQTDQYAIATTLGPIEIETELNNVLNNQLSASTYALGEHSENDNAVSIQPVLSFQSVNGDWCREYLTSTEFDAARVLACKQNSQWHILLAVDGQQQTDQDSYATASSGTSETFDTQIDNLMDGDALSVDQERELVLKGWK